MQTDDVRTQLVSIGTFETEHAAKYLGQLCKHFAHKVEVTQADGRAEVAFGVGPCTIEATSDLLSAKVSASDEEGLSQAKYILDSHLARFAFREGFEAMSWTPAESVGL